MKVIVPGRLLQIANGRFANPFQKARLVKEQKARFWGPMINALNEAGLPKATEPRELHIHAYVCGRLYDHDNLMANVKPIADAAVAANWVVDDGPEWCKLQVTDHRVATKPEQRIEVEVSQ
jgi:hypothetical protein